MVKDYLNLGFFYQAGFMPDRVDNAGNVMSSGWGMDVRHNRGAGFSNRVTNLQDISSMSWKDRATKFGPDVFGAGFTLYGLYSGYQDDGWGGVYKAFVTDWAASAGAARWAFGSPGTTGAAIMHPDGNRFRRRGLKNVAGAPLKGGMLSNVARYSGGLVGSSIGYAIGDKTNIPGAATVGALAGGYIGAAPMAAAARNPIIAAGLAIGAVGASIGYGAYHVTKAVAKSGYRYSQMRRGIDTSGSTGAFMTQGAFTMRSRAVQAMHRSHMNARSALGQEASFLHNPSRNYHSRYR